MPSFSDKLRAWEDQKLNEYLSTLEAHDDWVTWCEMHVEEITWDRYDEDGEMIGVYELTWQPDPDDPNQWRLLSCAPTADEEVRVDIDADESAFPAHSPEYYYEQEKEEW